MVDDKNCDIPELGAGPSAVARTVAEALGAMTRFPKFAGPFKNFAFKRAGTLYLFLMALEEVLIGREMAPKLGSCLSQSKISSFWRSATNARGWLRRGPSFKKGQT